MPSKLHPSLPLFAILVLGLGATLGLYGSGLHGPFLFDDFPNIVHNPRLHIEAITATELSKAAQAYPGNQAVPRSISMLSFAFNHYVSGLDPWAFKFTNLLIHVLNGLLVFWLVLLIGRALSKTQGRNANDKVIIWAALLVTILWLVHPLNLSTVLYVVQRMTSLAALFTLLGLVFYVRGRLNQIDGRSGAAWLTTTFLLCWPLAILSKENGALLPLYLLVLEAFIFRFTTTSRRQRTGLGITFTLAVGVPAVAFVLFLAARPDWLANQYAYRDFTLMERLLTEARVVWHYVQMSLLPKLSNFGLFHDDIVLSRGLLDPPRTLWAVLGLLGAVAAALSVRNKAPLLALGVFWFLAGHSLESSVFALEIAHEHRNYLPLLGILIPLGFVLARGIHVGTRGDGDNHGVVIAAPGARVLGLALAVVLGALTALRADTWGDAVQRAAVDVRNHPQSARAHYVAARTYWQVLEAAGDNAPPDLRPRILHHFQRAAQLRPFHRAGALIALLRFAGQTATPIDVEYGRQLLDDLANRTVSKFSLDNLVLLGDCEAAGNCNLGTDWVNQVMDSALSNPSVRGSDLAKIAASAANLALARQDLARALRLAEQAVNAAPGHPQHLLNRSMLLIHAGRLAEAARDLHAARTADRLREYQGQIDKQQRLLDQLRVQARQTPPRPLNLVP